MLVKVRGYASVWVVPQSVELHAGELRAQGRPCRCVDSTREMLQRVKKPLADDSVQSLADIRHELPCG